MKKTERIKITHRPRRLRKSESIRNLVREAHLRSGDFVLPLFIKESDGPSEAISSMPGVERHGLTSLLRKAEEALELGVTAIALFPYIEDSKKDAKAKEAMNESGLLPQAIQRVKKELPELTLITDVAMDPYSSDGHDGLVKDGRVLNDETLDILGQMALLQAQSGADFVAPSDMMDGRVGYIREVLDANEYHDVGIISYAAKYASAFYGPFRDALQSAPKMGDKKSYQMDPANSKEALREIELDIQEGADIVMIKPALAYLDIIKEAHQSFEVPIAAYNVSGEYAMIQFAAQNGALDRDLAMLEMLLSIKRAGAKLIFTYFALDAAKLLKFS